MRDVRRVCVAVDRGEEPSETILAAVDAVKYMYPDTIVALLSEGVMAHVSPDPHGLSDALEALAAVYNAMPPGRLDVAALWTLGLLLRTSAAAPAPPEPLRPGVRALRSEDVALQDLPYLLAVASRAVAYVFGGALKMLFVKRPGVLPGAEPEQLLKVVTPVPRCALKWRIAGTSKAEATREKREKTGVAEAHPCLCLCLCLCRDCGASYPEGKRRGLHVVLSGWMFDGPAAACPMSYALSCAMFPLRNTTCTKQHISHCTEGVSFWHCPCASCHPTLCFVFVCTLAQERERERERETSDCNCRLIKLRGPLALCGARV